uniref:Uncharacterized protein n=1 Tax=Glossina austeni TaxID=7395 RepID=A0A1A9UL46_GLOAU
MKKLIEKKEEAEEDFILCKKSRWVLIIAAGLVALKRALHKGSPSTASPTCTVICVPKPPSFTITSIKMPTVKVQKGSGFVLRFHVTSGFLVAKRSIEHNKLNCNEFINCELKARNVDIGKKVVDVSVRPILTWLVVMTVLALKNSFRATNKVYIDIQVSLLVLEERGHEKIEVRRVMDKNELQKKITREVFQVVYSLTDGYDKKYIPESKILSEVKQHIENSGSIPNLKILVHICLENLRKAGVLHRIDPEHFSANQMSSDAASDFAHPSVLGRVRNLMGWIGSRKRRFSNTSLHTEDTQAARGVSLENDEVESTCKRLRTNSGDVLNIDHNKPVMKSYEMYGLHPHLNRNLAGSTFGEYDRELDQHLEKISLEGSVYSIDNEDEICSCSESSCAESVETTNAADELTQTIDDVAIPTKNDLEQQPPFENDGKASGDAKIKDECASHSGSSSEQILKTTNTTEEQAQTEANSE